MDLTTADIVRRELATAGDAPSLFTRADSDGRLLVVESGPAAELAAASFLRHGVVIAAREGGSDVRAGRAFGGTPSPERRPPGSHVARAVTVDLRARLSLPLPAAGASPGEPAWTVRVACLGAWADTALGSRRARGPEAPAVHAPRVVVRGARWTLTIRPGGAAIGGPVFVVAASILRAAPTILAVDAAAEVAIDLGAALPRAHRIETWALHVAAAGALAPPVLTAVVPPGALAPEP